MLPCIPNTLTSGNVKRGLFTVPDFVYDAENDRYTCPVGKHLTKGKLTIGPAGQHRPLPQSHGSPRPARSNLDARSTRRKRVKGWEHEDVLDKMQARLDRMPNAMTIRRQTVEHPFGTLKAWMGSTHFLTRTLEKVKTEMSLHVLAYNMKRMINIFGVKPLMTAIAV